MREQESYEVIKQLEKRTVGQGKRKKCASCELNRAGNVGGILPSALAPLGEMKGEYKTPPNPALESTQRSCLVREKHVKNIYVQGLQILCLKLFAQVVISSTNSFF